MKINLVLVLLALVALAIGIATNVAGQKVTVGQRVAAANLVSMDQIDHASWDQLLQKYVNERGQVNYRGWQASGDDLVALDNYLNTLSRASTGVVAERESVLAFWINAYNAVTVKGILREYPTSSIRNHTAKLVGYNIWKDLILLVGNSGRSLDDIEHQILRPLGEPRIHFAIVCASHSCPRLLNRAYTKENLENLLALNTRAFFADPENFRYDAAKRQFQMSSILKWFGEDFGEDQAAQLNSIAAWLPKREATQAALNNSVRVSWLKYDWSLNDQD